MEIRSLLGCGQDVKKIALFGLGVSNLEILRKMTDNVGIVIRSDTHLGRDIAKVDPRIVAIYDGEHSCDEIDEDVIVFSPSVRRDRYELLRAAERGVIFTSDCEMFSDSVGSPVFAVTGSDGKSTTATILSQLLRERYPTVALCGNIGSPMLTSVASDAYAVELSSFQLTYSHPRVMRAAITNITPNHLNWHTSFDEYRDAKLSLLRGAEEYALSADNEILSDYIRIHGAFGVISAEKTYMELKELYDFSVAYTAEGEHILRNGEPYIKIADIVRKEKHNLKNLMLALAASDGLVSQSHAVAVARSFGGLAHRMETVAEYNGIKYIDSSIDTSPSRCISTLSSLTAKCVVILGGRKKGVALDSLVPIVRKKARAAVVMGECREELYSLLTGDFKCIRAEDMRDAVEKATEAAECSDSVILSPGATSYDLYSSYAERGDDFKKQVKEYINALKCK